MKIQDWIEQPDRDCFSGEDTLSIRIATYLGSAQNCLQEIIYFKVVVTVSISKCGGQITFLVHVLLIKVTKFLVILVLEIIKKVYSCHFV